MYQELCFGQAFVEDVTLYDGRHEVRYSPLGYLGKRTGLSDQALRAYNGAAIDETTCANLRARLTAHYHVSDGWLADLELATDHLHNDVVYELLRELNVIDIGTGVQCECY